MNLQAFVEQALVEIRQAVDGAHKKLAEAGLLVPGQVLGDWNTIRSKVDFDVAVEASTEGGTSGGGGIKVLAGIIDLKGGASTEVKEKEACVSRVKFSIPLYLPPPVGTEPREK